MRALGLISLILGLAAVGALALAVATDYWLYTIEPINLDMFTYQGEEELDADILKASTNNYFCLPKVDCVVEPIKSRNALHKIILGGNTLCWHSFPAKIFMISF